MRLIHIPGRVREGVNTPEKYQQWLRLLKDGDAVILQQFQPPARNYLDFTFERWLFEYCEISSLSRGILGGEDGDKPFSAEDGTARYWGGKQEWGNVFPARIIPLYVRDIPAQLRDPVVDCAPVYEPLWFQSYRHVFKVSYGENFSRASSLLCRRYPRYYILEVDGAWIVHAFSSSYEVEVTLPIELTVRVQHLYTQELRF